jgi:hypothetical protein
MLIFDVSAVSAPGVSPVDEHVMTADELPTFASVTPVI